MFRKTIGETLKQAVAWPTKFLFGDDIFISYSRADGATYAAGLADELAGRKFSCRFDLWGTEPGKEMPNSLKRALKRSAVLVLVGSPSAAKSVHVAQEVAELKRRGRKIIPVAFDGILLRNNVTVRNGSLERIVASGASITVSEALWAADIEGLPLSCEKVAALKTGDPSPDVISRIEKTFTFSRKDERLRKTTAAIGVVLIILIGASIVAGYVATKKGKEAALRTSEAAQAETRARASELRAKQQEDNAKQQTLLAEAATLKATDAEKLAGEKTRLADEKTKLAAEKTRLAAAATKRADEQTAKADEASKRAATQELSAHKNLARSYYAQAQAESNTNPLRALAWANTAVREAPSEDENKSSYMVRALDLAARTPLAVINSPTGLLSASFSPACETIVTFSASGKFAVWDGYTGESLPHPFPDPGFKYELDLTNLYKAVFSSDGSRIALLVREPAQAGENLELHLLVWEARTGRALRDIRVEGRVGGAHTMSFSPDDQEILITMSRDIGYSVWNIASGKERIFETPMKKSRWAWDNKTGSIWSQNPARNWFLNVRDKEVIKASAGAQPISAEVLEVRENLTGKLIAEHPLLDKDPHEDEVAKEAAFTPDAQKIVLLSEFNGNKDSKYKGPQTLLRVWNVVTGRASTARLLSKPDSGEYSEFGIEAGPWSISRDGKRLLITNSKYNFISVWDISGAEPDWKSTISIPEASNGVKLRLELAFFTEDDQNVIGISLAEDNNRVINVWSAENYHLASQPFIVKYGPLGFDVSPGDKTVNVLQQDGTLLSWDLLRDGSFSTVAPDLPKTQDMAFESAVLTPDRLALLTIGYHHGAMNEHGPHVMQLWDAATGVKKWPADLPAPSTPDRIKFSSDGSRFFVMPKNREYYEVGVAVRQLSDGENLPGFRPITVPLNEVEFSRDGNSLVTAVWISSGPKIKFWSATTGEPLSEESSTLLKDGYFIGFTRFGEYYVTLPPGFDADESFSELILSKANSQPNQRTRLRFADNNSAALAVALLRQAQKIEVTRENEVVAILDSGIRISIEQSPTGTRLTNQATKLQLIPILDSQADLSQVIISPDGRMAATTFAAEKKTLARVWDVATGLPLSERLWGDDEIKDIAFTPDSARLLIADKFGVLRSWFFPDSKGDTPPWMLSMSEALTGQRVVGGADVQRMSPEEYAKMRRKFGEALTAAAAAGDQRARFLLAGRKR